MKVACQVASQHFDFCDARWLPCKHDDFVYVGDAPRRRASVCNMSRIIIAEHDIKAIVGEEREAEYNERGGSASLRRRAPATHAHVPDLNGIRRRQRASVVLSGGIVNNSKNFSLTSLVNVINLSGYRQWISACIIHLATCFKRIHQ